MYRLDFSHQGRASFTSLDKEIAQRILVKLKWLVRNIESISLLPLKGSLSGLYKLKVGDWRVIYEVNRNEKVVTVHKAGHRKEVYR